MLGRLPYTHMLIGSFTEALSSDIVGRLKRRGSCLRDGVDDGFDGVHGV
jgi:hypothetical protein